MEKDCYLYSSRDQKVYFSLPPLWSLSHFIETKDQVSTASVGQMAQEALDAPIGTVPLKDLVSGAKKLAILVDDWTRPTPVADILEVLLPYLVRNGIAVEKVTIVVALGTHVSLTPEELAARVGNSAASVYRIIQHDARQHDLLPVVVPEDGSVVKINPEVVQADVKIGISSILPHPMAGFGGGPKIVTPGVSDFEFVRNHHMRHTIHPQSRGGVTKGNPFHESCLRAARAVGLNFSINCVYNQHGEIVRIIGGSLEEAFSGAVEACYKTLGVRFEEKVDITITSTYPHTHGVQICKGLDAPDRITKETGAILMFAPMVKPIPTEFVNSFDQLREKSLNNPAAYVKEAMGQGKPFLPDRPIEFNMAMSNVILRPKIRTILVSELTSEKDARTMGFDYAPSVEEGMRLLGGEYPNARVAIFPSGGLIIPMI